MTCRGTSVVEFFERFPHERACLDHIFDTRWGTHSPCPECGNHGKWYPVRNTKRLLHSCRSNISVLKDTAFYRSNHSLMAWFYALLLFCNSTHGMRSSFVRKQLGIGIKGAHRICNQIRLHLAFYDRPLQLGGAGRKVYVDEAYLRFAVAPGKSMRTIVLVLGFACEGKVVCGIIPDRTAGTLHAAIRRWVAPGSIIVSDGHFGYRSLAKLGWKHIVVNHSIAFHNFQGVTTSEIESYWNVVKRTLRSYRQVGPDNLWKFLAEIEFRYNYRHSEVSRFDIAISAFPAITPETIAAIRQRYCWDEPG